MKQHVKAAVAICAVTVTALCGCAKQQIVKQDRIIPPVAATAPAVPAKAEAARAVKQDETSKLPAASVDESAVQAQTPPAADAAIKGALEKIYFEFDSYALSQQARDALAKNAELLKKDGAATIRIEGHCDELGSDDYNLALGERRAKSAEKYLRNLGVPSDRLTTISYGKEKPADTGHDEPARAKNRRDEFVVVSK